jgi:maleate cis-trans isomerase
MPVEYAPRGLVGTLTPQANTTVEPEFSILWPAGIAMINGRLTSTKATIEERLVDYFDQLEDSLKQFANAPIDAIAVACTGASYLAGGARERDTLRRLADRTGVAAFTAASAVVDALNALGARRIGLVSPYPATLTAASVRYWRSRGFDVAGLVEAKTDAGRFHPIYAMPASGAMAALETLAGKELDAIVMLGTGMPSLQPIGDRPRIGRAPVMSCMLCLAWRTVTAIDRETPSAKTLLDWIAGADWRPRLAARAWTAAPGSRGPSSAS